MSHPLQILIADNRAPVRRGLRALLSQYPQLVVVGEAADGQEAVRLADTCRPDVVLLDMQMPVLDGPEATRRIKSRRPRVRVIALSMYSGYRTEALRAGVDAFLLKGCTAASLLEAITGEVAGERALSREVK